MEKLYHLTAPDLGHLGTRKTVEFGEWQAERTVKDLSEFLDTEGKTLPHMTHPDHFPNPRTGQQSGDQFHLCFTRANQPTLTLVLDRQHAEWAYQALSSVLARQQEKTPTKTVGHVTVNTSVINAKTDDQQ